MAAVRLEESAPSLPRVAAFEAARLDPVLDLLTDVEVQIEGGPLGAQLEADFARATGLSAILPFPYQTRSVMEDVRTARAVILVRVDDEDGDEHSFEGRCAFGCAWAVHTRTKGRLSVFDGKARFRRPSSMSNPPNPTPRFHPSDPTPRTQGVREGLTNGTLTPTAYFESFARIEHGMLHALLRLQDLDSSLRNGIGATASYASIMQAVNRFESAVAHLTGTELGLMEGSVDPSSDSLHSSSSSSTCPAHHSPAVALARRRFARLPDADASLDGPRGECASDRHLIGQSLAEFNAFASMLDARADNDVRAFLEDRVRPGTEYHEFMHLLRNLTARDYVDDDPGTPCPREPTAAEPWCLPFIDPDDFFLRGTRFAAVFDDVGQRILAKAEDFNDITEVIAIVFIALAVTSFVVIVIVSAANVATCKRADEAISQGEHFRSKHFITAAQQRLLAFVLHELKSPLHVLDRVALSLSEADHDDPDVIDDITSLQWAVESLKRLAEDVLDHERLRAGRMRIIWTPTDVNRIVRDVLYHSSKATAAKVAFHDVLVTFARRSRYPRTCFNSLRSLLV